MSPRGYEWAQTLNAAYGWFVVLRGNAHGLYLLIVSNYWWKTEKAQRTHFNTNLLSLISTTAASTSFAPYLEVVALCSASSAELQRPLWCAQNLHSLLVCNFFLSGRNTAFSLRTHQKNFSRTWIEPRQRATGRSVIHRQSQLCVSLWRRDRVFFTLFPAERNPSAGNRVMGRDGFK